MNKNYMNRYIAACTYPGELDDRAVESALREYLAALGVQRDVVRLRRGWTPAEHPPLSKSIFELAERIVKCSGNPAVAARAALDALAARDARAARDALDALAALDAWAALAARDAQAARVARDAQDALDALAALDARDAWDARAAQDARDARDALDARDAHEARVARVARAALDARDAPERLAQWAILGGGWRAWRWDLSWLVTTLFGAKPQSREECWARPMMDAFLAGCWILYWTDTTLYWVAKPRVYVECNKDSRRLHRIDGPACENDVEDLYFINSTLVPRWLVETPAEELPTNKLADLDNAQVRAEYVRKIGIERLIKSNGAKSIHVRGNYELLDFHWNGRPRHYLKMLNPSVPGLWHVEGVPNECRTVEQALAWRNGEDVYEEPEILT